MATTTKTTGTGSARISKRGPTNSLGAPWTGETWRCERCGETGPDRDDVAHSACSAHPSGRLGAPHALAFSPEAHDALVCARSPFLAAARAVSL